MGVRLSEEEAWEMIGTSHTGILTTLRRDGWPVSLPMWFAAVDRRIYVSTLLKSMKVARIGRDNRVSFLVESGKAWKDLAAVVVTARATIIEPGQEAERALSAIATKYQGQGVPEKEVPEATRKHYAADRVVIRLDPAGPMITWNNAKLRARKPS